MAQFHVVTDSSARFSNPRVVQQYPITVLPNLIEINGVRYREDIDISTEDALRLIATSQRVRVHPPTVEQYNAAFSNLAHADGILCVTASRELSRSWANARESAQHLSEARAISVIDSRTICAGLGMLVRYAGQTAESASDFEGAIKQIRRAVDRIYSIYYAENFISLQQNGIVSPSRGILGSVLGVKPFITIEEGRIVVIEKVRSRSQAIERLVEFLIEFTELDDSLIVQSKPYATEQVRNLQDRLSTEFPNRHFPNTLYGASLAAHIGTEATGIIVLESETEPIGDEF